MIKELLLIMCKHQYQLQEKQNTKCPLPSLFDKYEKYFDFELEYDRHEVCIFHSKEIEWKRDRVMSQFVSLISGVGDINKYHETNISYQFMEFRLASEVKVVISDLKLNSHLDLKGSIFHDFVEFSRVNFDIVNFMGIKFNQYCKIDKCTFKGIAFQNSSINRIFFDNSKFEEYCLFTNSTFKNTSTFSNCTFTGHTSFEGCHFNSTDHIFNFKFEKCIVKNTLDFNDAHFKANIIFENTEFNGITSFINTYFDSKSFVGFYGIKVTEMLTFKGTDVNNKLFNNEVAFLLEEKDISGSIIFENVNFLNILKSHREHLISMQKEDKVEIGKGCIKYRLRSPIRKIKIHRSNQGLVTELTNTFLQFFQVNNGINLGIEIEERTDDSIAFYYFSDEDLTYAEFEPMLQSSEQQMWKLIKVNNQSITSEKSQRKLSGKEKYMMATDTMINLVAIILKISMRLPIGKINREEINSLLKSTSGEGFLTSQDFETLNINQTIMLGIGNSQEISL